MFYEDVFQALDREKVKYVVVGGGAVVLHGVVRMTVDLDLFVGFEEKNLLKFMEVLHTLGYRPKIPVTKEDFVDASKREAWKKEKNMQVFSFFHLKRHQDIIDIFMYEPIKFQEVYKERKIITARHIRIPIVSIKHLKKLKKIAGRPQDLADIEALKDIEKLRKEDE